MATPKIRGLGDLLQPLEGVFVNRLEHEEPAPLGRADQALVDQRLQALDLGAADGLGGLQREAAGEDAQSPKELSFRIREKVVAPVDRPRRVACLPGASLVPAVRRWRR